MTERKPGDTDRAPPLPPEPSSPAPAELEHTSFRATFSTRAVPNNLIYCKIELGPKQTKLERWSPNRITTLRRLRAKGGYAGVELVQMGVEPFKELEAPIPLERLVEPDHDNVQIVFVQGVLRLGQFFAMEFRNTTDAPVVFWVRPIGFGDHLDAESPWEL